MTYVAGGDKNCACQDSCVVRDRIYEPGYIALYSTRSDSNLWELTYPNQRCNDNDHWTGVADTLAICEQRCINYNFMTYVAGGDKNCACQDSCVVRDTIYEPGYIALYSTRSACSSDSDCQAGQICSSDNICVQACSSDSDCNAGQQCSSGHCLVEVSGAKGMAVANISAMEQCNAQKPINKHTWYRTIVPCICDAEWWNTPHGGYHKGRCRSINYSMPCVTVLSGTKNNVEWSRRLEDDEPMPKTTELFHQCGTRKCTIEEFKTYIESLIPGSDMVVEDAEHLPPPFEDAEHLVAPSTEVEQPMNQPPPSSEP